MTTLYYKDDTSDKVYQVNVDPASNGYNVNFAYGRRGSTLTTGTKNTLPLPKADAEKLADKLVKEKMAKGYTPGLNGTPYKNMNNEDRSTSIYPMLLNAITEEEIPIFVNNDNWILQNKYNGKRMLVRKVDNKIDAINRSGLIIGAPQGILDSVAKIPGDFILDGEAVGDSYYVFDLVDKNLQLRERLHKLNDLVSYISADEFVIFAPYYVEAQTKEFYVNIFKNGNYEGIVFKSLTGYYTPGRPSTGGIALKYKFTATANVRVVGINTQRSVEIALEGGISCGNVTVPPNKDIPDLGDIIEVRYLYAMPNTNALYQPFYSLLRDDISIADNVDQLKFKREERGVY